MSRLLLALLLLTPCAAPAQSRAPADFALEYGTTSGALPPQYAWTRTVRITRGGEVTIVREPGRGGRSVNTFRVAPTRVDSLYRLLRREGVFTRRWGTAPPLAGAQGRWLAVTAGRRRFRVPADFTAADRARGTRVYAAVESLLGTRGREAQARGSFIAHSPPPSMTAGSVTPDPTR